MAQVTDSEAYQMGRKAGLEEAAQRLDTDAEYLSKQSPDFWKTWGHGRGNAILTYLDLEQQRIRALAEK